MGSQSCSDASHLDRKSFTDAVTSQEAAGQEQTSLSGLQRQVSVHPLCSAFQQGLWPVQGMGSCQFIMIAIYDLSLEESQICPLSEKFQMTLPRILNMLKISHLLSSLRMY